MQRPEQIRNEYYRAFHDAEDRKASLRESLNKSGIAEGNERLDNLAKVVIEYFSKAIDTELVEPVIEKASQYAIDNLDVLEKQARDEMEAHFIRKAEERARIRENQWLDLQENLRDLDELRLDPDNGEVWLPYNEDSDVVVDRSNVDSVEFYLIEGFMGPYAEDMLPEQRAELTDRINDNSALSAIYQKWTELGSPHLYLYGHDGFRAGVSLNFTLAGEMYSDRRPLLETEAAAA